MEDRYSKYIQLSFGLFFTMLAFILSLLLLLLGLRLIFGLLDQLPWFVYLFTLFILLVPSVLFFTVYIIYCKRTTKHPSVIIRNISFLVFIIALLLWAIFFVWDMIIFFKTGARAINRYHTYNLLFLSANVFTIFFIGVLQALSTEKEKDWINRNREEEIME